MHSTEGLGNEYADLSKIQIRFCYKVLVLRILQLVSHHLGKTSTNFPLMLILFHKYLKQDNMEFIAWENLF